MDAEPSNSLDTLVRVAEGEDTLTKEEFEEIVDSMETRKKYSVESYNMLCTSADVVVVCDMDTQEFIQIEIPQDAAPDDEVIVTRDA
ncbi:hypothetical protein [Halapricum desulfuricans]|uniref:hypothetical protein n=1 Tax=Halapricum desulfuricans TaxID=2841257 RepID=UPI001E41BFDD|nr:hypothetical protein [Halapricum desulfuricans]